MLNDLGAPAFFFLSLENCPPDLPIQGDEFSIDHQGGPDLRSLNALDELSEEIVVAGWAVRRRYVSSFAHALTIPCLRSGREFLDGTKPEDVRMKTNALRSELRYCAEGISTTIS